MVIAGDDGRRRRARCRSATGTAPSATACRWTRRWRTSLDVVRSRTNARRPRRPRRRRRIGDVTGRGSEAGHVGVPDDWTGCGRRTGWRTSSARTGRRAATSEPPAARSAGPGAGRTRRAWWWPGASRCSRCSTCYPYNPGHLMVCPYRHVADYTDLDAAETVEFAEFTRRAMRVIRQVTGAARLQRRHEPGLGGRGRASPRTCTSTWCRAGAGTPTSCPWSAGRRCCRSCSATRASCWPRRGRCRPTRTDAPRPSLAWTARRWLAVGRLDRVAAVREILTSDGRVRWFRSAPARPGRRLRRVAVTPPRCR